MKRFLFSLSFLWPLLLFAQKPHSYTFDFSKPQELIPAITPAENAGEQIVLNNEVFNSPDRSIFLSFSRRDGSTGALLTTASETSSYLFIGRGGFMTVTGVGVEIDSLIFSRTSKVGSLTLKEPQGIGYIDSSNESWYGRNVSGVTKLVYENVGFDPAIQAFTVFYNSPMNILEPQNVYPGNESEVTSFSQFKLTFNQNVKLGATPKAILRGPLDLYNLNLTQVDDKTIVASLEDGVSPITTISDDYQITIFENSIVTNDGDKYYNKQLTYHFSIIEAHNIFDLINVYPAKRELSEIPNGIILEFPSRVKYATDRLELVNTRTGEVIRELTAGRLLDTEYTQDAPYYKADKDIYCFVKLTFADDFIAPVRTSGIYSLTIPEGFLGNTKFSPEERNDKDEGVEYNPEITIEYNVNGVVYPSDEVLQAAKDLLAITGAGYPAVNSPARLALQALIDGGIGADADFEKAIEDFYAETQIEMPSDGYYLLSAVPSEGEEVYLSYENGKIGLTKNVADAAHLLATVNEDKTIVFTTPDNKFVSQLMPNATNVTSSKDKKNNLTFARFVLTDDGITPQQLFGLWSINGIVATDDAGTDHTAYALVNVETMAFATDLLNTKLYFTEKMTNAFRLTETDAPVSDAQYSFYPAPGSVSSLMKVTLTFPDIANVSLASQFSIALVENTNPKYIASSVTRVAGTTNSFALVFEDVLMGTYDLTIPKGTFTYSLGDGRIVDVQEIKETYTVTQNDAFRDFNNYYFSSLSYIGANTSIRKFDDELDNFIIMMDKPFNFTVTDKVVRLMRTSHDVSPIAEGHFEVMSDYYHPDYGHVGAIKFVLDKQLVESIETELYQYEIPAGVYGDENYGKYLKDPTSILKSQCYVNSYMTTDAYIFNKADMVNSIEEAKAFNKEKTDSLENLRVIATKPGLDNRVLGLYQTYENALVSLSKSIETAENALQDQSLSAQELYDIRRIVELLMKNMREAEWLISDQIYTEVNLKYMSDIAVALRSAMSQLDPVGLSNINANVETSTIFDLSGRRVKDMNKAGIYIVGGRKVVVK